MPNERKLGNWIDAFVEYTDGLPTPLIFRRWGAISAMAGLLERRVWVRTAGREAYPNLFNLLVGPPGVGKSETLREVARVWKAVKDLPSGRKIHVAPDNLTKAKLLSNMEKAGTRLVLSETALVEYYAYNVVSSEFSVFLPQYDSTFMSVLTDLFDCKDEQSESTVSRGDVIIPNPCLNMIGGTTPGFLASTFPETAWSMGFSSRLLLIYCAQPVDVPLFGSRARPEHLWDKLVADAREIAQLWGELSWSEEAIAMITSWNTSGRQPVPSHPKLVTYNTRRILQVIKLIIISSAARSSAMRVEAEDVATAIALLLEAEQYMPRIFNEMGAATGGSGGQNVLLDLHHWALNLYSKSGQPLRENRIVTFVSERVQYPSQVLPLLTIAVKNGMFEVTDDKWTPLGGQ